MNLAPLAIQKFFDNSGNPMNGGLVYTYTSGTSSKVATYIDASGVTQNTNPIQLDYRGECRIWLDPTLTYKFTLAPPGDTDPPTKPIWTVDNITSAISFADLTQQIIGQILYPRTAAEITAGVTPVLYYWPPYVRGRYANFSDWRLACDQAGAEGSLEADYAIAADTVLPKKCDFKGFQITGAFYTTHELHSGADADGYVYNWKAKQPRIRGNHLCRYTGIDTGLNDTGFMEVWGGNGTTNPGTFWCDVQITYTTKLTINADNFDVNQNDFHDGIARYIHLTGGASGGLIEANTFRSLDFANNSLALFGYVQDDTAQRFNHVIGCYYESGSNIVGNVHIGVSGFHGDGLGAPLTGRYGHILGANSVSDRLRGDYLSLSPYNIAEGGCWDVLDSSLKPPSLSQVGGASVSVVTDVTTPGGIGKRYEATMEQDQDRFGITFDTVGQAFYSAVIDYKSTLNFQAITSDSGSVTSYDVAPATFGMPTNWKRIRISGAANTAGNTTIRLIAANGGSIAPTAFSIGGFFVGTERAVPAPGRALMTTEKGTYTVTATGMTASITGTAYYERNGDRVTLQIPTLSGTSNAATFTLTGLPSSLFPARTQGNMTLLIQDNGVFAFGSIQLNASGVFTVYKSATSTGADWTAANAKAAGNFNYTYLKS